MFNSPSDSMHFTPGGHPPGNLGTPRRAKRGAGGGKKQRGWAPAPGRTARGLKLLALILPWAYGAKSMGIWELPLPPTTSPWAGRLGAGGRQRGWVMLVLSTPASSACCQSPAQAKSLWVSFFFCLFFCLFFFFFLLLRKPGLIAQTLARISGNLLPLLVPHFLI